MSGNGLGWLVAGLSVAAALGATVATAWRLRDTVSRQPTPPVARVPDSVASASGGHRVGRPSARATVLVFSDYECKACAVFASRARRFVQRNHHLAIAYRHAPLPYHPFAVAATRVSECSARLGHFSEVHHALLARHDRLGSVPLEHVAVDAGVRDTLDLRRCLRSGYPDSILAADRAMATMVGVKATPTFVVGGAVYSGVPWDLEAILGRARASVGAGARTRPPPAFSLD